MNQKVMWMILGGLMNVVLVLLVAPFCQGILRKITARVQSRIGPPIRQPYYDLLKLLGKEDIESGEAPVMQRFVAYLSLAVVLTVACLVPMGFASPMNSAGDAILLIYLLTLCGICTLIAGLASGSTYSLVGTSREMMCMLSLEPLLAIAIIVGAIHMHSLRLETVLNGSVYGAAGFTWSGFIMLALMLLAFQAFVGRVPFDIAEAETEIMEGPMMEYSGPKLALFKLRADGKAGRLQWNFRDLVCAVGIGAGLSVGLAAVLGKDLHPGAAGDPGRGNARALPN